MLQFAQKTYKIADETLLKAYVKGSMVASAIMLPVVVLAANENNAWKPLDKSGGALGYSEKDVQLSDSKAMRDNFDSFINNFGYVFAGVGFVVGSLLIASGIYKLKGNTQQDPDIKKKALISILIGTALALIGLVIVVLMTFGSSLVKGK